MKTVLITSAVLMAALASCAGQSSAAGGRKKGQLTNAPRPHYPVAARPYLYSGAGIFLLHFKPDGTVSSVTVEKSTGHKVLDDEATSTFSQWRCRPGAYTVVRIPMSFTTHGAH